MASYVDQILQPDEKVRIIGRRHWAVYWPGISMLIVALILWLLHWPFASIDVALDIVALIALAVAIVLLAREWIDQWGLEIVVTNRRVIYKRGIISRYTTEMNMEKIESVVVDQDLPGRLLGYGAVEIRGTGAGIERLKMIAHPLMLRNAITAS